jgi:hypothetical protein
MGVGVCVVGGGGGASGAHELERSRVMGRWVVGLGTSGGLCRRRVLGLRLAGSGESGSMEQVGLTKLGKCWVRSTRSLIHAKCLEEKVGFLRVGHHPHDTHALNAVWFVRPALAVNVSEKGHDGSDANATTCQKQHSIPGDVRARVSVCV